jgi:hypothetical protein
LKRWEIIHRVVVSENLKKKICNLMYKEREEEDDDNDDYEKEDDSCIL